LNAPVTGLSNPLGWKFVLKMITSMRNPPHFVLRRPTGRVHPGGMRHEDSGSAYQRKKVIEWYRVIVPPSSAAPDRFVLRLSQPK
jgi:hypothetical protein